MLKSNKAKLATKSKKTQHSKSQQHPASKRTSLRTIKKRRITTSTPSTQTLTINYGLENNTLSNRRFSTNVDQNASESQVNDSSVQTPTSTSKNATKQSIFTKPHTNPTYITNPIFYVNGQPHIGHLYTSLLSETLRNWKRSLGNDTFVLGGTDEHGIKVQEASEKAGFKHPLTFCDQISHSFETAWGHFKLSPDAFLRTTSDEHEKSVQWMWKQLARNGYIYLGKHSGWYCKSDEVFVPLNQLVEQPNGSFKTQSGHDVVWLEEENFKFRLSKLLQPLMEYYYHNPSSVFPQSQLNQVLNATEGLEDISISRLATKLGWSSDVPDGDDVQYWDEEAQKYRKASEITTEKHKVYVWLDALNIYITGARHAANMLRKSREEEGMGGGDQVSGEDVEKFKKAMEISGMERIEAEIEAKKSENGAKGGMGEGQEGSTERPPSNIHGLRKFKLSSSNALSQESQIDHVGSFYEYHDWFQKNPHQKSNQHISEAYQSLMAPMWPPSMHVIGKDIVKFHAVYWPAFLIGCGLPLPGQVVSHSHWLVNGQKMSKSLGNVVSPQMLEETLGIENSKYALMRLGMIGDDSDFQLEHAVVTINAELSDTIGNLAMRCTGKAVLPNSKYPDPLKSYRKKVKKGDFAPVRNGNQNGQDDPKEQQEQQDNETPADESVTASIHVPLRGLGDEAAVVIDFERALADGVVGSEEIDLVNHLNSLQSQFNEHMSQLRIDRALMAVAEAGRVANGYFSVFEPWKMAKVLRGEEVSEEEKAKIQAKLDIILYHSIESVRMISLMLRIVTPDAADVILDQLSFPRGDRHLAPQMALGWHPSVSRNATKINPDQNSQDQNTQSNQAETDEDFCCVSNVPFAKIKLEKDQPKKNSSGAKQKKEKKAKEPKESIEKMPSGSPNDPTSQAQTM